MRFKRNLAVAAGLWSVMLASNTLTPTVAPMADSGPPPNGAPTLMSGSVRGPNGTPVHMADITVYVETATENGSLSTPIAKGRTTPTGKFVIYGNLRNQQARDAVDTATRNPDGSVFLEVEINDGVEQRYYNIDAMPPGNGRPDWSWGETADPNMLSDAAAADFNRFSHKPLTDLEFAINGKSSLVGEIVTQHGGAAADLALMSNNASCPSGIHRYVWVANTAVNRWLPLMMDTQRNRTSMKYKWNTTKKTKLQLLYGYKGEFAATAWEAGLSYSKEQATGVSYTASFGNANNTATRARYSTTRALWKVQKQKKQCADGYNDPVSGVFIKTGWYDTDLQRYYPRKWEGDVKSPELGEFWYCNYDNRSKTDGTIEIERGKTTVWGSYVGIAGFKLDGSQSNTDAHILTIWPSGGFKNIAVCGYNAKWPYASATREVPWY